MIYSSPFLTLLYLPPITTPPAATPTPQYTFTARLYGAAAYRCGLYDLGLCPAGILDRVAHLPFCDSGGIAAVAWAFELTCISRATAKVWGPSTLSLPTCVASLPFSMRPNTGDLRCGFFLPFRLPLPACTLSEHIPRTYHCCHFHLCHTTQAGEDLGLRRTPRVVLGRQP